MKKILIIFGAFLIILAIAGSFFRQNNSQNGKKDVLTVAAASDLILAFEEIGMAFETETSQKVQFVFSSSGVLRDQIRNGAPFDLYASANIKFVEMLIEKDRIFEDSKEIYAVGRIGIAVNKSSGLVVNDANDLLNDKFIKVSIADPSHAPYGLASKETLKSLELWENITPKLVYAKDIQHALTILQSGNAEVAFIALSIADFEKVDFLLMDEKLHNPLLQAIGVVKGTKLEAEAREFIQFVNGEIGRLIMEKYGFIVPEN